jgi:methylphosphotriester-DNA--protein-cysteine methyltransferase
MKAIFNKDFNHTPKRMGKSWRVRANKKPQIFPQHVIDAAVKAGVAKLVADPTKTTK